MRIYFSGSISGGRGDVDLYAQIIALLKNHGSVLTEHIGQTSLSAMGEENVTSEFIYNRDFQWLKQADVVVAEVTTPSLGVGYEIGIAEQWGKPIFCLFRPSSGRRLSAMIESCPGLKLENYATLADIEQILKRWFQ